MPTGDRNFDAAQQAFDNLLPEDFEFRVKCCECGVSFWMKGSEDVEPVCADCSFEPPDTEL